MNNETSAYHTRWDLGFLYKDAHDPHIDRDMRTLTDMMRAFHAVYKGKLAETLAGALRDYAEITMLQNKFAYLFLKQSLNTGDAAVKAKLAEVERVMSQASGEYLEFFKLELVALDDSVFQGWYSKDSLVLKHRPWIEHVRIFRPHFLSESVESALTKRSPFGDNAWSEFFDELESDLRFMFQGEAKTLTEMLHILTESSESETRFQVLQAINAGLAGSFSKYAAQTLYIVSGLGSVEDKERKYKNPMDARNKSNRIPNDVVNTLHDTVREIGGPLAQRFYRLKAAHLGLRVLRWSDRNAVMPFRDTTEVPFDKGFETVRAAYQSFSPTLAKLVQNVYDQKWIDAPATPGKRGGAFNATVVLPGGKPASFTFLNYLGSSRDVMTLAHELGHGVHGLLASVAQGPLMYEAPIAYAETASVFGEMITFNFLKNSLVKQGNNTSRLALLMSKIDDIMNTVVRQIGFSNFERQLHGMDTDYKKWHEPKKRSVPELDALWLTTLEELYGKDGEVFTYKNAEHMWAYISHFHRPFYVYGYAFGELLTHSLYAQAPRLGKDFEPLYLDLLRAGSTKDVAELLKPFGLDPTKKAFWKEGIEGTLGTMIEEAEGLSRAMGISV